METKVIIPKTPLAVLQLSSMLGLSNGCIEVGSIVELRGSEDIGIESYRASNKGVWDLQQQEWASVEPSELGVVDNSNTGSCLHHCKYHSAIGLVDIPQGLSPAERDIYHLLLSNPNRAYPVGDLVIKLGIVSEASVRSHISHINQKLGKIIKSRYALGYVYETSH